MSAHGKKKKPLEAEQVNMGFQIAPMIDVVFVIMLFFMVMAGQVKVEKELNLKLPGVSSPSSEMQDPPDEITVSIEETGHITLNEEEMGSPEDKKLEQFYINISRLKQEADARNGKVLVTISAQKKAKYERIIDVINSMARAKVNNLTFTIGEDE
jgi:biopolymer transport protein ExbD